MKNSFLNSFLKIIFALVFCFLPFLPSVVSAGTEHNMSGFAWSSNIGWISFNNTSGGGNVNYGVNKDASGNLVGYAWSSNVGWIQFGGLSLSGFPSGAGTTASNAQVVNGNLVGWVRVLSNGGGWDGWIALSGTGYGVNFNSVNESFSSFAWGSEVVGWVDFSRVMVNAINYTVTATDNGSVNGDISPSSRIVSSGNTTTFTVAPNPGYTASIAGTCPPGALVGTTYTTGEIFASCTVTATFTTGGPFTLTVTNISRTGTGKVTTPPPPSINCGTNCTASYTSGTRVNLSAVPTDPSGTFIWSGDCSSSGSVTMSGGNKACTVEFYLGGSSSECSNPMTHFFCGDGITEGTEQVSSPTKWKWKCGNNQCSQNNVPGFIED